jgi:hypothetical protein
VREATVREREEEEDEMYDTSSAHESPPPPRQRILIYPSSSHPLLLIIMIGKIDPHTPRGHVRVAGRRSLWSIDDQEAMQHPAR